MKKDSALAKTPTRWSEEARQIYKTARHHMAVEQYLLHQLDQVSKQKQQSFVTVAGVLSSFTIELLLKSIEMYEKGEHSRGHNLGVLFSKISKPKQQEIIKAWDDKYRVGIQNLVNQTGETFPDDLPMALQYCGDTFITLRYQHEREFAGYYLSSLPYILIDLISRMAPEWHIQVVDIGNLDRSFQREIIAGYLDDLPRMPQPPRP